MFDMRMTLISEGINRLGSCTLELHAQNSAGLTQSSVDIRQQP